MMFDISGAIREGFRFLTTALQKFVKSVEEKEKEDKYNAKKEFKEFRKKVLDEKASRTSDLRK